MKQIKVKITNKYIHLKNLAEINNFLADKFKCTKISRNGYENDDPKAKSIINMFDVLDIECLPYDAEAVIAFLGEEVGKKEPEIVTRESAVSSLLEIQQMSDTECAHSAADGVLRRFLLSLGYDDVIREYDKVEKWYA